MATKKQPSPSAANGKKKRRPTLEQFIEEALARGADFLWFEESKEAFREHLKLQYLYPDEDVIYIDHWKKDKDGVRRLTREVLGHGPDLGEMIRLRDSLPPKLRKRAKWTFAEDPFPEFIEIRQ